MTARAATLAQALALLLPTLALGSGGTRCAAHTARWTSPPAHTPTTAQVSVPDGPLAGNGILGLVTAPHREAYPSSPPNQTALGRQTLWIGSNSFWSANTYGADEAGAAWVPPSGGPFPHCEVPYGMLSVGGVTVDFASGPRAGENGSYSATQDLCRARISTTVTASGSSAAFGIAALVLADDNAVLANLSCSGCSTASAVTVELWVPKGRAPFDQATCGPDNMPRGSYILPTSARVVGDIGLVTRSSQADGINSAVLAPCGPYVNDATQNFTLDQTSQQLTLLDGRCLLRAGKSTARGATGDKTTVGACTPEHHTNGGTMAANETWTLQVGSGQLVSSRDGFCLSQVPTMAYLEVRPCSRTSTRWTFHITSHNSAGSSSGGSAAGILVAADGQCLTVVEPSWIDDTALAMTVVDAGTGERLVSSDATLVNVVDETRVRATLTLQPNQTITLVIASLTSFEVHGNAFAQDPLRTRRLMSKAADPAVVNATMDLLASSAARLMPTRGGSFRVSMVEAHERLWSEFWDASSIEIAGLSDAADSQHIQERDSLAAPLALLEANYYGSQYILQSAGRVLGTGHSGRVYPSVVGVSSLFGPFSTGDYIGWNGDITLNYNAESPLYGAPSSNHPELALPYFDALVAALPLARRRASRQPWPGGGHPGRPGLPGQQVDEYTIEDKGGYVGVNYPGHIGPFGLHDWTDRGQRSNGAFAAVPFIEYFEHTGNISWLRSTGNPFVNEIASFYTSYMVREEADGEGTAWMAWPRVLGALSKTPLTCPQHTLGAKAAQCIVSKQVAGRLCYALPNCTGIAYTSDAAWNKRYPGACMLSSGPPVASGPAGSAWDVASWASHTKPTVNPKLDSDDENSTVYTWNIPKSCSMELCALGGFGASLEQANPALELPLVRRVLSAAVHFSALLYPKPDEAQKNKVSRWTDILEHLAPLPLTTITASGTIPKATTKSTATTSTSVSSKEAHTDWVWAETNVSSAAAFGANQWYPLDYFSPMHPGDGVGLSTRVSDPETFALARRTVAVLNAATTWIPESGAQMDWIAAVRLGWNATDLILHAAAALAPSSRYPMFPSLYGTDGGGGLETCGATLAVNEMLLQSHEGALRFFPTWPANRRAAFSTLRTKGAFLVSAEHVVGRGAAARIVAEINSTIGGNCSVFGAKDVAPIVTHGGVSVAVEPVSLELGEPAWRFLTIAGEHYSLQMKAVVL